MGFSDMALEEFLRQAASGSPVPGGGGVAALVGSLGGCMGAMVANFTVGKPQFAEHDEAVRCALGVLERVIDECRVAVDGDAEAFLGISEAYRLPRGTEEEKAARKRAVDGALLASMRVPLGVLRCCGEGAGVLIDIARFGNPNLLSDAVVSGIMFSAAARAARVNVYANSSYLKTDEAREAEVEAERIVEKVVGIEGEVERIVADRSGK